MNFFKIRMVFLSIGRGAMKRLRACGILHKERLEGLRGFGPVIGNFIHNCQLINKDAQANFNGLSQDGGMANFLKISKPLSLIKTYRIIPLSARSISMDSTFIIVLFNCDSD
jgi:hypothetical protein